MPEGNTVWLIARTLRAALAGRQLTTADLRAADLATTNLRGRTVTEVIPRGKHLLIRFDNNLTLHTHLRMDGSWRVQPAGRSLADPHDHVRVVLGNATRTAIGDRVHDIALIPTTAEDTFVGHLGPDLLGTDWDADQATLRIMAHPQRPIAEALLDQRNLAGAGNVYKAEACFLRGLSPWTPVGDVRDIAAVVDIVHRLLRTNRERYEHVTTGDARPGRRTWVYDRAGKPCRRCGATVQVAWQGEKEQARVSYWCANCQPGPSPAPAQRGVQRQPRP
jgi:formamidopyrimidine-DNA glycosylase